MIFFVDILCYEQFGDKRVLYDQFFNIVYITQVYEAGFRAIDEVKFEGNTYLKTKDRNY